MKIFTRITKIGWWAWRSLRTCPTTKGDSLIFMTPTSSVCQCPTNHNRENGILSSNFRQIYLISVQRRPCRFWGMNAERPCTTSARPLILRNRVIALPWSLISACGNRYSVMSTCTGFRIQHMAGHCIFLRLQGQVGQKLSMNVPTCDICVRSNRSNITRAPVPNQG